MFGMKTITQEELAERLELHAKWLYYPYAGQRLDLRGVDLSGVDLRGLDLRGADLRGMDLRGVDLSGVDLAGADLSGSDLRGLDPGDAKLWDANLDGADLPDGMRAGESLGYSWVIYGDDRFGFGCETRLISDWLGGMAETLSQKWQEDRWQEYACEIRRILGA